MGVDTGAKDFAVVENGARVVATVAGGESGKPAAYWLGQRAKARGKIEEARPMRKQFAGKADGLEVVVSLSSHALLDVGPPKAGFVQL